MVPGVHKGEGGSPYRYSHKIYNLHRFHIIMNPFQEEIVNQLFKATNIPKSQIALSLETPPEPHLGDFSFPCFQLAKELKKSPVDIASSIIIKLKPSRLIERIEQKQAYINFFISTKALAESTLKEILKNKKYGKTKTKPKKIVIEYPSPNTNKPLHLGHVRNILIGQSLSSILKFQGHKVFQVNLNNDRGIHICKSMLAYQLFGNQQKPNKKSDHFVGDFYVKFSQESANNPNLETQAQELLIKWESKDKQTRALWKLMNSWALLGFKQTYKKLNLKFNKQYYESQIYNSSLPLIKKALSKGIFEKDEKGNIVADLSKYNLGKKVVLRADGTSIYLTQDIALAQIKESNFHPDLSIYVVASEQEYHFQVLFKILSMLNIKTKNLHHLSYGMVYLPEGRMKSREGNVVDADDLINEVISLASSIIKEKHPKLPKKELETRSRIIGLAALRFFILKFDPKHDFIYNPKESLSFEGETGPYLLYTYARIQSILKKTKLPQKASYTNLEEPIEKQLILQLSKFPSTIKEAEEKYKLSLIASYLINLSKTFNQLYHELPVLQSDKETKAARLHLIKAVSSVLASGLSLLGIETLNEM